MNQDDKKKIDAELVKIWDTLDSAKALNSLLVHRAYQKGYDRALEDARGKAIEIKNPKGLRGEWPTETLLEFRRVSAFGDAPTVWLKAGGQKPPGFWNPTGKTAQITEDQKCLAKN